MEIVIKLTDTGENSAIDCLNELSALIQESEKKNDILLKKGRTKIDMIGEKCHAEILVKENKQLQTQS